MIKKIIAILFFPFFANAQTAFISGNDTICANALDSAEVSISFNGVSPFTFIYSKNGEVQAPDINTFNNPHIISVKEEGYYSLVSFSDLNGMGSISGQAIVTVLNSPVADFITQPDSMTILYPTTQFIDMSAGEREIVSWQWYFGDNTTTDYSQNPYHTYPDTLETDKTSFLYETSLIVGDVFGCADTVKKIITITDEYWMYIPNSFTPDKDGINDKFCIAYNGVIEKTFYFNIYDRFSNLVYSTNNIHDLDCDNGWDGTHQATGKDLPIGTYIYQIYYQDFEGWHHQESSELIIVR